MFAGHELRALQVKIRKSVKKKNENTSDMKKMYKNRQIPQNFHKGLA